MKKTPFIITCIFAILFFSGIFLFFSIHEEPIQGTGSPHQKDSQDPSPPPVKEISRLTKDKINEIKKFKENKQKKEREMASLENSMAHQPEDSHENKGINDIEEIRQRIYDLNIEHMTQIERLDDLVQTGETDTRMLWGNDWASADDWKKTQNGFRLGKTDEGQLVFYPDDQTAKTYSFFETPQEYTYDEENREFVNEIDFYGKTIYNVAKFINDDVLVMMTISGEKVDMNIYQKNAGDQ